jgi:hypothetical protein
MYRVKVFSTTLLLFVLVAMAGCNKKNDPRNMVYKTWTIGVVNMEGDEVGQAAAMASTTIEFTKKGIVKLDEQSEEISGTFEINETATSLTTTMDGSTDTFVITGLSEKTMTLSKGKDSMVLTAK